jgi:hypothetical protein
VAVQATGSFHSHSPFAQTLATRSLLLGIIFVEFVLLLLFYSFRHRCTMPGGRVLRIHTFLIVPTLRVTSDAVPHSSISYITSSELHGIYVSWYILSLGPVPSVDPPQRIHPRFTPSLCSSVCRNSPRGRLPATAIYFRHNNTSGNLGN